VRLGARGHEVRVIDDLSAGSPAYLAGVDAELIEASVDDAPRLSDALGGVTAVIHLAARAGIPDSVREPLKTFQANVTQTVGLLEAARVARVERFLGDASPPFDEAIRPSPTSPYGASKLAGEAYCQAYAATFGLSACALRFSNAYGPRSLHKQSVVAAWLRQAVEGEPITIDGTGDQTRDFIFVDDVAAAIEAALDAPAEDIRGEVFQIGTGCETSVNHLARMVLEAVPGTQIRHGPGRHGEAHRNVSRIDKASQILGFRASTALESGVADTAAWFRAVLSDPEMAAIRPQGASGSE
jgi:UDP-glucose 4-epimerase